MTETLTLSGNMFFIILSVLVMSAVTFFLRAFPTCVPRKLLDSPYLKTLNVAFPISVMTLLILSFLNFDYLNPDLMTLLSKILALALVLISYHYIKNIFVSIIIGVAALNGFLYLFIPAVPTSL